VDIETCTRVQVEELRQWTRVSGGERAMILDVAEEKKVAHTALFKRLNTGYF
jgi:hypothetical protein